MKTDNIDFKKKLPIVCVQGLGVVGSAMSLAVASSKNKNKPRFNVVGLEKNTKSGIKIIDKINNGKFPFLTSDKKILNNIKKASFNKNFFATTDYSYFKTAKVIISSIGLDFFANKDSSLFNFKKAISEIAKLIDRDSLFILESSVPPGTTEKIVLPIFEKEFKKRKINKNKIKIVYSYERVMPGDNYYDSVVNYWRVFSSNNDVSKKMCRNFFSKVLNIKKFPLTYLESTTACELSKILENTFRATNIALIDEWSKFSEKNNIDLFKIIEAIKIRPTHKNIMLPGFGVGGYCLTKDPLFGIISSKKFFKFKNLDFPISKMSVKINNKMPFNVLDVIRKKFKSIHNKKILIIGATYKDGIDDVRFSPTEILASSLIKLRAKIKIYDQYVKEWKGFEKNIIKEIKFNDKFDIIILTVSNNFYKKINLDNISIPKKTLIVDANNVISKEKLVKLKKKKLKIFSVGRGYIE